MTARPGATMSGPSARGPRWRTTRVFAMWKGPVDFDKLRKDVVASRLQGRAGRAADRQRFPYPEGFWRRRRRPSEEGRAQRRRSSDGCRGGAWSIGEDRCGRQGWLERVSHLLGGSRRDHAGNASGPARQRSGWQPRLADIACHRTDSGRNGSTRQPRPNRSASRWRCRSKPGSMFPTFPLVSLFRRPSTVGPWSTCCPDFRCSGTSGAHDPIRFGRQAMARADFV